MVVAMVPEGGDGIVGVMLMGFVDFNSNFLSWLTVFYAKISVFYYLSSFVKSMSMMACTLSFLIRMKNVLPCNVFVVVSQFCIYSCFSWSIYA